MTFLTRLASRSIFRPTRQMTGVSSRFFSANPTPAPENPKNDKDSEKKVETAQTVVSSPQTNATVDPELLKTNLSAQATSESGPAAPETPVKHYHKDGREMTPEEVKAAADEAARQAAEAERLWQMAAPDRYWGVTSPGFGLLLGATVTVILYNEYNDTGNQATSESDVEKEARLRAEEVRKLRQEKLAALAAASNNKGGADAEAKWAAAVAAAGGPLTAAAPPAPVAAPVAAPAPAAAPAVEVAAAPVVAPAAPAAAN